LLLLLGVLLFYQEIHAENYYLKYSTHEFLPYMLEAVHQKETGGCVSNCAISYAGARGPMQFMPGTWKAYGCDGNGDERKDVYNIDDSLCGAANYLTSLHKNEASYNVGLADKWIWWKAAYRYNAGYRLPASHNGGNSRGIIYADSVLEHAERLRENDIKPCQL